MLITREPGLEFEMIDTFCGLVREHVLQARQSLHKLETKDEECAMSLMSFYLMSYESPPQSFFATCQLHSADLPQDSVCVYLTTKRKGATSRARFEAQDRNMDPGAVDFLHKYEVELFSMQRPDKGIINALTMMAADHIDNAVISNGIVRCIERCIQVARARALLLSPPPSS